MKAPVLNILQKTTSFLVSTKNQILGFIINNWRGLAASLAFTLVFFSPILPHLSTYSEGGDSMFNAWTIMRAQNCILGNNCKSLVDGNILYPNENSLVYSEAQLSTAFVSLPLRLFTDNPILINNLLTVIGSFLLVFCMYLLLKHISKGNELISIVGGLIFAYAPMRMYAIWHLQNYAIFTLPIIVLMILMYAKSPRKRYLIGLFLSYVFVLYGSWYQGVFASVVVWPVIIGSLFTRGFRKKEKVALVLTALLALVSIMPLAKVYADFSAQHDAHFALSDQVHYSSSVADFVIPVGDTVVGGAVGAVWPGVHLGPYNPDSSSYNGWVLYVIAAVFILSLLRGKVRQGKKTYVTVLALLAAALGGLIISLGPVLKIKSAYLYSLGDSVSAAILMPYALVDKLLPQLSFMRSLGRADVIILFVLVVLMALFVGYVVKNWDKKRRVITYTLIVFFVIIELMPTRLVTTVGAANLHEIPPAYTYIRDHIEVDNIVVLAAGVDVNSGMNDKNQARLVRESMLWAGYDNRYTYNGFSGYAPQDYYKDLADFTDFDKSDIAKMSQLGLRYVLLNKIIGSGNSALEQKLKDVLGNPVYTDSDYSLYKL